MGTCYHRYWSCVIRLRDWNRPHGHCPSLVRRDLHDLTPTACTATNLHDHAVDMHIELVYHNDDTLPYPVAPETLYPLVENHTVQPGEATVVKSNGTSGDNHLARCLFDYTGDPDKVKAAIIIEHPSEVRSLSLPAEVVSVEP